jgi:hypothetical protein
MITAAIDAHEQCNVATINIPGAFLHAYNAKETFLLLKGCLAELMVQVDAQLYRKFVINDKNNQALLYVKLSKAIYGLLKSTLLFYRKFVKDLKNYKTPFTINPYNPCIANAMINGKQMTITWHVNNLKVSHVNPFQITKFAADLATIYGNGLVLHRGKIHNYLGMDLNFAMDGIAQVSMITYTSKILTDFPKPITTSCATPAADHPSPYARKARPNSCQKRKPKPSITQLPNSCSSANKPKEISRWLSLSSQRASNAQTKTTGVNLNLSYDTSVAPIT